MTLQTPTDKKTDVVVVVSETSLRSLVRELLDVQELPANVTEPSTTARPVVPNPLLGDGNPQETLPLNPVKIPKDTVELRAAAQTMLKHVPNEDAGKVFKKMKAAMDSTKRDGKDTEEKPMAPKKLNVEEVLRAQIRQIIMEAPPKMPHAGAFPLPAKAAKDGEKTSTADLPPVTKLPPAHGPSAQDKKNIGDLRKWLGRDEEDPESKEPWKRKAQTAANLGSKGGGEFAAIAQEFGLAPSGAKRAYREAMMKAQDVSDMMKSPDGQKVVEEAFLTALDDYIGYLASSGELSEEEVQDLKTHPEILIGMSEDEKGNWSNVRGESGSDEFREFLDKYITKARKEWHGEEGWKSRYAELDLGDK